MFTKVYCPKFYPLKSFALNVSRNLYPVSDRKNVEREMMRLIGTNASLCRPCVFVLFSNFVVEKAKLALYWIHTFFSYTFESRDEQKRSIKKLGSLHSAVVVFRSS